MYTTINLEIMAQSNPGMPIPLPAPKAVVFFSLKSHKCPTIGPNISKKNFTEGPNKWR